MDNYKEELPLIVKSTGGITAQLLALSNAIYLSERIKRDFQIMHFPYSTGTYWPLGIQKLLKPTEIAGVNNAGQPIHQTNVIAGQVIPDFSLKRRGLNREKISYLLQKLGVHVTLKRIMNEVIIGGRKNRLFWVNENTKAVSGNFVPYLDSAVASQLEQRFISAKLPNPFQFPGKEKQIVIHYRLGDMRRMPSRIPGLGGHGVVDPHVFRRILELEDIPIADASIRLVSDEPAVAAKALLEVGINTTFESNTTIWDDLKSIASAKLFIGSMSQFSIFGALLCANNGGRPYLPSTAYGELDLSREISRTDFAYFDYSYLRDNHWLFSSQSPQP